jgi:hypothetical protein
MSWKTLTIVIILVVCILSLIASHAVQIFRQPDTIEIVQIPNINHESFYRTTKGNSPLVVTNISPMSFVPPVAKTPVKVYERDPTVYSPRNTMEFGKFWRVSRPKGDILFHHPYQIDQRPPDHDLTRIGSPLTVNRRNFLSIVPKGFSRRVGRTINEYNIYTIYTGSCRFQLYHPKYQRYLPAIKSRFSDYQYTEIMNHRLESDNHHTRHAKFVEIILRPGQALIIPTVWSYGYEATESSVILNTVTNNPFTYLFQTGYHLSSVFLSGTT